MELRRFSPDSVIVHPPVVCCRSGVSLKSQQKARNMCIPLINQECSVILEQLRRKVMGETVLRKPGFVFVPPSVVEQNVKRKPEMDLAE